MGASTAYHLAKKGCHDIVVLEKDLLGFGATGKSAGGIRQQFSTEANVRISIESVRFFENFMEELDTEIDYRQFGYLFLITTDSEWKDFNANVALQKRLGVPVELLSREQVKELAPYLWVDDVIGGTFCPTDGYADPHCVVMGLAKGARRLGVKFHEKTAVREIRVQDGKVLGVVTSEGEISAPVIVNAAGPWAGQVGQMAGVQVPVNPYRRQIFVTAPFDELPQKLPVIIESATSFYFRREGPGILMGMSDEQEPSSFNTNVDWEFLTRVVERAVTRAPVLEKAGFMDGWAGSYEITPDRNPIIDCNIGGIQGFHCAAGFSGHGFMQGPAVGRIMADLILGREPGVDLGAFAFDRFQKGQLTAEQRVI